GDNGSSSSIFQHQNPLNTNAPSREEALIKTNITTENTQETEKQNIGISNVNLLSISSAPISLPMSPSARTPLGVQEMDGLNSSKSWLTPRFVSLRGMMGLIRTANTIDA